MTLALLFTSCSNDEEGANPLAIGDFHEGGVIFYLDITGQHGLVCAVSDQSTGVEWGCWGTAINGADGIAIGTGAQNTIDIVTGCTTSGIAADLCANLTLNSFSDWFLPSRDELNEMYLNKATIDATATANGGTVLAAPDYWSSSENSINSAWSQNFDSNGKQGADGKDRDNQIYVRAVRAF